MKALFYTFVITTLLVSSCATSGVYLGGEYDDLYYVPSDKPVVSVQKNLADQNIARNIEPKQYYDNIYANDTLVADQYTDAVDFNNSMYYNNNSSPFEYMDDWSYSNRLRRFYGNYFDPYWRDPYYNNWGYPSSGFGFNYGFGYPYYGGGFYNGFYDPFMSGGYYGDYYGGYYGSLYNPFYYGGIGYYPGYSIRNYEYQSAPIGRRERYSTLSNSYSSVSPSRKASYTGGSGDSRRMQSGSQGVTSASRRSETSYSSSGQNISTVTGTGQNTQVRRASNISNSASVRPQYNSVNRTYTPSYSNPRMSTRPSYNNSRISSGTNSSAVQNSQGANNYRSNSGNLNRTNRSNSSFSGGQSRTITSPARSGGYSNSSRRSEGSSGYSGGGSYSNSSSGGGRSSSYSSGSSSSSSSSGSSGGHGRR